MIPPGVALVEEAGVPPVKVHSYDRDCAPQLETVAEGLIIVAGKDWQTEEIGAKAIIGGFSTVVVCGLLLTVPQEFVVVSVML